MGKGEEVKMKKIVILGLLVFLLTVLPAAAQTDELAGTWIGFNGPDFTLMRFSADEGILSVINTLDDTFTDFTAPYHADDQLVILTASDGEPVEMPYSIENGKLHQDLFGEQSYTRIDDNFFPEDPESSPYIGEKRQYRIEMTEDGGIRIFEYLGDEETVTVPSAVFGIPVTEIGESSFCYRENMKHLILPEGIEAIGARAFEEDQALEDVSFPRSLESIGAGAFMYCYHLHNIMIPEGVKIIGDSAFWECSFLKTVMLPESLEEIGPDVFYGMGKAAFFVKPGSYAEQFCLENEYRYTALENKNWDQIYQTGEIPESVMPLTTDPDLVGTWITFWDQDIIFFRFSADGSKMELLNSFGYYPEYYSDPWEADGKTIIWSHPDSSYEEELPYYFEDGKLHVEWYSSEYVLDRIDDSLYPEDYNESPYFGENKKYWTSQLEDGTIRLDGYVGEGEETVSVPDNVFGFPVTVIGGTAFMSNDGVKNVILPEGITAIGSQAFSNNAELKSVQLPGTLKKIGYSAFEYCHSLEEIVIPEGVTFIDTDAFWGCENLTSVVLPSSLEEIGEGGAFDFNTQGSILFTVPEGSYAEQYCRENELTCVTPDGEKLTGGPDRDDEIADEPFDAPAGEDQYQWEEGDNAPAEPYEGFVYGNEDLYNEAMSLYNDERYYSARQAFIESEYGDWEEMAEKCLQDWPAAGEIWRDRSQWLQDMELTIVVEQPADTGMFIRIFKDNAPVSYLFLSGSDKVTVRLPGNGYYVIKDGVGYNWYGMKEAFGSEGTYETMTFDDAGTEKVYLQSNYAYTLSINVSVSTPGGDTVYSESEDWESFVK